MSAAAVDWLARRAELSPAKIALVDPERGERISYREWNRRAELTARGLVSAGAERGDRVAVLAENSLEVLDLLFACGKLGAVFVPLNWRLAEPELERLLAHAGPRLVIADTTFAERAAQLVGRGGAAACNVVALAELAARGAAGPALPPVELAPSDPWVVCYTGGSTGVPKGVVQTHGSITWNAVNTVASWGIGPDDIGVLNAPLFHTGGLHVLTTPLVHAGGTSIVCRRFDPAQVLALLAADALAPTLLFGVPTMFLRLVEHPDFASTDLSRLRLVISGGAPAPARLFTTFFARGVAFRTGYGLTEAGPNNFWLPAELAREKPGAVGWPLFHIAARLVGEDGQVIDGADLVGELELRGPHLMAGYLDEPDATAEVLSPSGWLATGDLARRDGDGAYWIVGRAKEMFISGGENVYPAEVEDVLCDHPAVVEAAVIGAPHPAWGEIGVAFVSLRAASPAPADPLARDELAGFVASRLARYKLPRRFELVAELPRTGAGKVDRSELRRRAILIAAATSTSSSP